jgi:hypothetical protein
MPNPWVFPGKTKTNLLGLSEVAGKNGDLS